MLKKSILLMCLAMLGQVACGSLVSIKGPSVGAEECGEGEVRSGVGAGGVNIWPFVEIEGPSVGRCVQASSLSMDDDELGPDTAEPITDEADLEIAELGN